MMVNCLMSAIYPDKEYLNAIGGSDDLMLRVPSLALVFDIARRYGITPGLIKLYNSDRDFRDLCYRLSGVDSDIKESVDER